MIEFGELAQKEYYLNQSHHCTGFIPQGLFLSNYACKGSVGCLAVRDTLIDLNQITTSFLDPLNVFGLRYMSRIIRALPWLHHVRIRIKKEGGH